MSKTFESEEPDNRELEVGVLCGSPRLLVKDFDGDNKGFIFGKADAPALALAILEAAGVEPDREPLECQVSLGTIVADLQGTIQYAEALASANREQAELEAEALDFLNAVRDATGAKALLGFPAYASGIKSHYLIIARKAREMRKS